MHDRLFSNHLIVNDVHDPLELERFVLNMQVELIQNILSLLILNLETEEHRLNEKISSGAHNSDTELKTRAKAFKELIKKIKDILPALAKFNIDIEKPRTTEELSKFKDRLYSEWYQANHILKEAENNPDLNKFTLSNKIWRWAINILTFPIALYNQHKTGVSTISTKGKTIDSVKESRKMMKHSQIGEIIKAEQPKIKNSLREDKHKKEDHENQEATRPKHRK